jgi:hypothetical protein
MSSLSITQVGWDGGQHPIHVGEDGAVVDETRQKTIL